MTSTFIAGIVLLSAMLGAVPPDVIRPVAAAGAFYPEEPAKLRASVEGFLKEAVTTPPPVKILACISPCSAYGYSGAVAGHAFKDLHYGQYDRVIILAGSHRARFEGCSIAATQAYITPLGIVPLDLEAVSRVCRSPLIGQRTLRYKPSQQHRMLHEKEHSIEVVLPFLQARLGAFKIVPMLVGQFLDAKGGFNEKAMDAVVDAMGHIMTESTLIVVSSDFTHYGNDFSYRPFRENVSEQIEALDRRAFDYLMRQNLKGFRYLIEKSGMPICGDTALMLLMKLLPNTAGGRVLSYDQSMRMTGNQDRSISYAALQFYDPALPPRPAKAMPALQSHSQEPEADPAPGTTSKQLSGGSPE